jgi:hypothetical protein
VAVQVVRAATAVRRWAGGAVQRPPRERRVPAQATGGEAARPPPSTAEAPALPPWAPVRIEVGRESMSRVMRLEVGGDGEQGGAAGVGVGGWEN